MPGDRGGGIVRAAAAAALCAAALVVAACAPAPSPTPVPPTPSPTPAPTPTPMPGQPLAAGYRPEGAWLVTFARPGDIVREIYDIALTCPDGVCDAIVRITDADGADLGKGEFLLVDGRFVFEAESSGPVDCESAGRTVRGGATARTMTELVVASYRLAGTATAEPGIEGRRTVTIEPDPDSGCAPSVTVYPATGARAG